MDNSKKCFLIDTNSLVTPFNTYYPFDFAERFWIQLQQKVSSGDILVMDIVRDELRKGEDELTDWINEIDDNLILSRNNMLVLAKYAEIINYINSEPCYSGKALTEWSKATVADPWLIAAAIVHDCTIVTFEKPNGNLNSVNPSKRAMIPDVADKFNVQVCSLYAMMRALSIGL